MHPDEHAGPLPQPEPENDLSELVNGLADDFSAIAVHVADWKVNYFGASASSRLTQAVADMELATARIKASLG